MNQWVIRCTTLARTDDFIQRSLYGTILQICDENAFWQHTNVLVAADQYLHKVEYFSCCPVSWEAGGAQETRRANRKRKGGTFGVYWSSQENIIRGESYFPGNG